MFLTPVPTKIVRIVEQARNVKSFYFKNRQVSKKAEPGKFLLIWTPFPANKGINRLDDLDPLDQIPMCISFANSANGIVGITVKKVGPTTSEMHKYGEGFHLGIIGPLGNSFSRKGDTCILVGGGVGVAPLHYLATVLERKGKRVIAALGFETKAEMFFVKEMQKVSERLIVATEDGTYGDKGMITDFLPRVFRSQKKESLSNRSEVFVYSCGPELMMKKVLELCKTFNFSSEFSLERYMHCGIGLCGFCAFNGFRVCKDGPIFSGEQLDQIRDFGVIRRKASGRKERLI